MNTTIPTQEFVIEYNLADVKQAINRFVPELDISRDGYYRNSDNTNEMFNTYGFNIFKTDFVAGMVSGDMRVVLQDIEGAKTKIVINSIAKSQGPLDNSRIMDIQNKFLNTLTQSLRGEYVSQPKIEGGGCLGVALLLLISTLLGVLVISGCKKKEYVYDCHCDVYGKGVWVKGELEQYTKVTKKQATSRCDAYEAEFIKNHPVGADSSASCHLREYEMK